MPKVITGAGLQEFIESGKHENIAPQKKETPKEAPPLEVKKEAPVVDVKPPEEPKEVKEPQKAEDDGLEPEDKDLSEIIRKKIGKKHRAMKEAQEAAADAESFAKNQYDRAMLAEQRAAKLAQELEEARKAGAPVVEAKAPDEKDPKYTVNGQFDWKQFSADQAEFVSDKKIKEYEARQAQDREAAEKAEAARRFKEKAAKIDGFEQKLAGTSVVFPNAVLEYITESEDGPEIVMHLIDNPETADRISKLRPIKAIAEIGKITKDLVKAKAVEPAAPPAPVDRGGAPPPITPISGSGTGTVNTDPAKMSFRELREYERAKRKH